MRPSSAAFVDVDDAGELGAAGADDLGGDGSGDVVLLEVEERLEAVALDGVFGDGGLLDAELGELLLKGCVLLAGGAEVDVVRPAVADGVADVEEEALERRDGGDDPVTNERDASSIRRDGVDRTPHLDRQPDGLGEQHRDEDQRIFVPREEGFHLLVTLSARWRWIVYVGVTGLVRFRQVIRGAGPPWGRCGLRGGRDPSRRAGLRSEAEGLSR